MNGEYMPLFRAFVEICKCIEEIGDFQEHPRSQILDSLRFVRFISTPPRLEVGLVHWQGAPAPITIICTMDKAFSGPISCQCSNCLLSRSHAGRPLACKKSSRLPPFAKGTTRLNWPKSNLSSSKEASRGTRRSWDSLVISSIFSRSRLNPRAM
jgi:hypothetical protein